MTTWPRNANSPSFSLSLKLAERSLLLLPVNCFRCLVCDEGAELAVSGISGALPRWLCESHQRRRTRGRPAAARGPAPLRTLGRGTSLLKPRRKRPTACALTPGGGCQVQQQAALHPLQPSEVGRLRRFQLTTSLVLVGGVDWGAGPGPTVGGRAAQCCPLAPSSWSRPARLALGIQECILLYFPYRSNRPRGWPRCKAQTRLAACPDTRPQFLGVAQSRPCHLPTGAPPSSEQNRRRDPAPPPRGTLRLEGRTALSPTAARAVQVPRPWDLRLCLGDQRPRGGPLRLGHIVKCKRPASSTASVRRGLLNCCSKISQDRFRGILSPAPPKRQGRHHKVKSAAPQNQFPVLLHVHLLQNL